MLGLTHCFASFVSTQPLSDASSPHFNGPSASQARRFPSSLNNFASAPLSLTEEPRSVPSTPQKSLRSSFHLKSCPAADSRKKLACSAWLRIQRCDHLVAISRSTTPALFTTANPRVLRCTPQLQPNQSRHAEIDSTAAKFQFCFLR